MPKQKRWALKQRLERAQEHLIHAMGLVGSVNEEIHTAHPESPPPLHEVIVKLLVAFGDVDIYRESI